MNEIRLEFARTGGGIMVRRAASIGKVVWQEEVSSSFTLAFPPGDQQDLRWYLEDFMDFPHGGSVTRAERVEASLDAWGRTLFDQVLSDARGRALMQQLVDSGAPRLLTVVSEDAEVQRMPWEVVAGPRGPLALFGIAVRRQTGEEGATAAFGSEPIGLLGPMPL